MGDFPNPFDGDVSDDAIESWLSQFDQCDRDVAMLALASFNYFGLPRFDASLMRLHALVLEHLGSLEGEVLFVPVGYAGQSGAAVAYLYGHTNSVEATTMVMLGDLSDRLEAGTVSAVVLLDDFVGTGVMGARFANEVLAATGDHDCRLIYAVAVGLQEGMDHIAVATGERVRVVAAEVFSAASDGIVSPTSRYVEDEARERVREVLQKYGSRLLPDSPFGFGGSGLAIGFFFSTPDNTLPIFWAGVDGWMPLLPHARRLPSRSPSILSLRGTAATNELSRITATDTTSAQRGEALWSKNALDVPSDIVNSLLSEFGSLRKVECISVPLVTLGVNAATAGHLAGMVDKMRFLRHEQRPVRSSLLVVADSGDAAQLGEVLAVVTSGFDISDHKKLEQLMSLVDGAVGCAVVDAAGRAACVRLFPVSDNADQMLPVGQAAAAAATAVAPGLLFHFPGDGRVFVFKSGRRLMSYVPTEWAVEGDNVSSVVGGLETAHGLEPGLLSQVVRVGREMTERGLGALTTLGDIEGVLAYASPQRFADVELAVASVGDYEDEALLGILTQDGATVIDSTGRMVQMMTTLRPALDGDVVGEIGKGTKHDTARDVSALTDAVCVAVSVDAGLISVYSRGELALRV